MAWYWLRTGLRTSSDSSIGNASDLALYGQEKLCTAGVLLRAQRRNEVAPPDALDGKTALSSEAI